MAGVSRRRPLVLTGGPAAGKSSTALGLAAMLSKAAVIEVDDLRQLVVTGGVAPWQGDEGRRQQHLGVTNAGALARNFYDADIDVVMTDVLTPASSLLYRRLLPECLIVHFHISFVEAQRRAATRKVFLTDAEFEQLHHADRSAPPPAGRHLEVDHLTRSAQIRAVDEWWRTADH